MIWLINLSLLLGAYFSCLFYTLPYLIKIKSGRILISFDRVRRYISRLGEILGCRW